MTPAYCRIGVNGYSSDRGRGRGRSAISARVPIRMRSEHGQNGGSATATPTAGKERTVDAYDPEGVSRKPRKSAWVRSEVTARPPARPRNDKSVIRLETL